MRIAIAGLGLIGGSIARGLAAAGHHVTGLDAPPVLRAGEARGRDRGVRDVGGRRRPRGCDVVFLAAPPRANIRLLRTLARGGHGAIVTDVGSVKRPICAEAIRLGLARFVGGHPMAGSAARRLRRLGRGAFRRARLGAHAGARAAPPRRLLALIRDLGARPMVMTPAEHDRAVAFLSHVPQIVAWALADAARADAVARRHLRLAGPALTAT